MPEDTSKHSSESNGRPWSQRTTTRLRPDESPHGWTVARQLDPGCTERAPSPPTNGTAKQSNGFTQIASSTGMMPSASER